MDGLNYHHLYYFWAVTRAGSISKASRELGLTQPTISEQLGLLEKSLGRKLFDRVGRSLVLTKAGQIALRHAEQIFSLGRELKSAVTGDDFGPLVSLRIVVDTSVDPAFLGLLLRRLSQQKQRPQLSVERAPIATAFPNLMNGDVDLLVGTDARAAKPFAGAVSHLLFKCGTAFLSNAKPRGSFPKSLHGQRMVSPSKATKWQLDKWLRDQSIEPLAVGQVSDPELARQIAAAGWGTVAVPDIATGVARGIKVLGRTNAVQVRVYGFTRERRPRNASLRLLLDTTLPRAR